MKYTIALLALLVAAGSAFADIATTPTNAFDGVKVPGQGGSNPFSIRTGGETIATATPIPSLPFTDVASTCGAINNYDEICPYGPHTSPDVVYSFTPGVSGSITISLCNSYYDTKLFVYKDSYTPGAPYGCNDDGCSGPNYPYAWLSILSPLAVDAGHTYYIVIDGYGGGCGTYDLLVDWWVPCAACPAGADVEGEPVCYDNYTDTYNGGCNSTPYVFQPLCPTDGNTAVMCGETGTYLYFGYSYRDTDWYTAYGCDATMTASLIAEVPIQLIFIYGTDCLYPTYDYISGGACATLQLSQYVASGQYVWLWVGPASFTGIPCGSDYVLTVTGICDGPDCQPDAVEESSWGGVKTLFR